MLQTLNGWAFASFQFFFLVISTRNDYSHNNYHKNYDNYNNNNNTVNRSRTFHNNYHRADNYNSVVNDNNDAADRPRTFHVAW